MSSKKNSVVTNKPRRQRDSSQKVLEQNQRNKIKR